MVKRIKSVCIVLPAYNEALVIGEVIKNTLETVKSSSYNFTVLVVNDSSTDNTSEIAAQNGAIVIDHILNTGAGGATATGIKYAKMHDIDIAATMDSDGQHAIEDVVRGIIQLDRDGSDLLIGSRLIDSSGMSKVKILGNKGLSFITYILFGVNSTDSQSGLRVYSRNAIENLRWKTSGYEFCSEMLWRAKELKMNIGEYPIQAIYTDYSKSKGQSNWNAVNIIASLLRRRVSELFQ